MATLLVQLPYTVRYGQPQSPSRASRLSAYVVLCTLTVRYGLTTYELLLVVGIIPKWPSAGVGDSVP